MMQNSEIRYFMAVVNTGSISAASQQLFVAVSAISRQIQRLESRLGVTLFERSPRGMVINDAGQILANHVRRSMVDMELAIAEIKGIKAAEQTTIRVLCTDGLAFNLLPMLLARFRLMQPNVSFYLSVASAPQVPDKLRRGECDVALRFSLAPEPGIEVLMTLPAPVLVFMSEHHALASRELELADLNNYPLALPDQSTTLRQLFDLSCRMNNVFAESAFTCNHFCALYEFVRNTPQAIGILSHFSIMCSAKRDGLILKTVNLDQLSQRTLQVQTKMDQPRTQILNEFFTFLKHELQRMDVECREQFALHFR
jgi:DNA-binding transcriptional LysR family regulator